MLVCVCVYVCVNAYNGLIHVSGVCVKACNGFIHVSGVCVCECL